MSNIITVFFITVHIAPFLFIRSGHSLASFLFVIYIFTAYLLGWYMARIFSNQNQQKSSMISFTKCRSHSLIAVASAYLLLRVPYVTEIFQAFVSGDFATYALQRAKARYSGESMGFIYNIGTAMFICFLGLAGTYIGIYQQNIVTAYKRDKSKQSVLLILSLIVLMVLVESSSLARAGVVMALTVFFANYLYAKRIDFQNIAYPKLMIFGAKITFFMLLIFYFSAYFRLSDNADVAALLIEKTYVYFIGPHESFSTWLSRSHESLFTSYGYNTFTSVFKLLGVSTQQGHYDKFLDSQTNIFLLYRGLLQDFGLILTGVIVIGLSYLANYSDAYLHRLPGLVIAAKASVCMLLFLFISPFIFTTFLVGFVLSNVLQKTVYKRVQYPC